MKKILITILTALTIFAPMQIAKAADERVVAIIDTAIDSSQFPSIIYEACFTETDTQIDSQTKEPMYACPNNKNFMEGKGSANSQVILNSKIGKLFHGSQMVKASIKTDKNVKIVFIRIANAITNSGGFRNSEDSLLKAINWVNTNASKYSIDAISISQARTQEDVQVLKSLGYKTTSEYTEKFPIGYCPKQNIFKESFFNLSKQNIPVFVATGNDKYNDIVGFPSCVDGAIGVGAVAASGTNFSAVTNRGPGLDIVAIGDVTILVPFEQQISGTSVATVVAATKYVGQTNLFNQFIAGMTKFMTYPFIK